MKKQIIFFIFLSTIFTAQSFENLTQAKAYAQSIEEFPEPDNKNLLNPNYSIFHRNNLPSIFNYLKHKLGIFNENFFDTTEFEKLLIKVTNTRKQLNSKGNNSVVRLGLSSESKIFIWGDLHGAFHSLVRALDWLNKEKIIDHNFKIIKPKHFLVFNGDAINRSPFTLETFMILLKLLEKNPQHVFYMRGQHETDEYWLDYGLKRELQIRVRQFPETEVAFKQQVNEFFNTLPLALYIHNKKNLKNFIRISHTGREHIELNEENISNFLMTPDAKTNPYYCDLSVCKKGNRTPNVPIIIKTEDWRNEHQAQKGLGLLEQDRGSTSWAVFSPSIFIYQQFYDFYYDAFALIDTNSHNITQSTITLYNRDTRTKDPFKKDGTFNLATGMPIKNGKEKIPTKEFFIGSSMSLQKGVPILGKNVKRGMSVRINKENQNGGIKDHIIRAIVLNDNYVPHEARQNIDNLLAHNIDTILLPIGSPTLAAYERYLKENKVLTLFPVTGAKRFRNSDLPGIINYRATYADEVNALIDYLYNVRSVRTFGIFYQDDAYGIGPFSQAKKVFEQYNISSWFGLPYVRASIDFEKQAEKIKEKSPGALGMFATAFAAQELIRQTGIDSFATKELFGISFLGEQSIRVFLKKHGLSMLFGAVVPNPHVSQLPIVQEYRKEMDKYNYHYDVFSLEGYIATSIFLEVLKMIDPPFTKDKIETKIESFNNVQFKGLTLTFSSERRDLSQPVYIETSEDKKWIKKTPELNR